MIRGGVHTTLGAPNPFPLDINYSLFIMKTPAPQTITPEKLPTPWLADSEHGKFSNDRALAQADIDTLTGWVDAGAPAGNPKDAPKPLEFAEGWNIGKPDLILEMPSEYSVPASGTSMSFCAIGTRACRTRGTTFPRSSWAGLGPSIRMPNLRFAMSSDKRSHADSTS